MVQTAVETRAEVLEYNLTVGLSAMEGRGFYYPTDTAIAPNGRLYVPNRSVDGAARGVRVTVCDIDSEYYGTFGYFGHDPGEFVWASCIAADSEGHLFISDEYTNRITVFDLDGNYQTSWGTTRERRRSVRRAVRSGNRTLTARSTSRTPTTTESRDSRPSGVFLASFGSHGNRDSEFDLPWGLTVAPERRRVRS